MLVLGVEFFFNMKILRFIVVGAVVLGTALCRGQNVFANDQPPSPQDESHHYDESHHLPNYELPTGEMGSELILSEMQDRALEEAAEMERAFGPNYGRRQPHNPSDIVVPPPPPREDPRIHRKPDPTNPDYDPIGELPIGDPDKSGPGNHGNIPWKKESAAGRPFSKIETGSKKTTAAESKKTTTKSKKSKTGSKKKTKSKNKKS